MSDQMYKELMKFESSAGHGPVEEAPRGIEEVFRDLYDEAPTAHFSIDVEGCVKNANRRAVELFGYPLDTLLGRPVLDFYADSASGKSKARGLFDRFLAGGEIRGEEMDFCKADGSRLWGSLWVRPIEDEQGCVVASHSIVVDITEHKRVETALRESEERFRKIFEYSNDAIFIIDPKTDEILDVNAQACTKLGYEREELLSLRVSDIHPGEILLLHAFGESVFEKGYGWTDELSCMTKSGDVLQTEISASVVKISGRDCMISLIRDITERKQAEA